MGCLRESIGHRQPTKVAKDAGTGVIVINACRSWQQSCHCLDFQNRPRSFSELKSWIKHVAAHMPDATGQLRWRGEQFGDLWQIKETLMLFWNPLNLPLADATKLCEALEACQLCIDELGLHNEISAEAFLEERERRCGGAAQANGEMALGQNWVPQNGW